MRLAIAALIAVLLSACSDSTSVAPADTTEFCRDGSEELRGSALEGSESRSVVFGLSHADALVSSPAALKTS